MCFFGREHAVFANKNDPILAQSNCNLRAVMYLCNHVSFSMFKSVSGFNFYYSLLCLANTYWTFEHLAGDFNSHIVIFFLLAINYEFARFSSEFPTLVVLNCSMTDRNIEHDFILLFCAKICRSHMVKPEIPLKPTFLIAYWVVCLTKLRCATMITQPMQILFKK